jgi:hypothetical protein
MNKVLVALAVAASGFGVLAQPEQERERQQQLYPTGHPTSFPTITYEHELADFSETKLYSPDSISNDYYGYSTAVWEETVLIGAYATVPVTSTNSYATGSVFVYENHKDFSQRLLPESVAYTDGSYFGFSVAVYGQIIAAGAPRQDSVNCTECGAVHMYSKFSENNWVHETTIYSPEYINGLYFGYAVSAYGTRVMIGAPGDNGEGSSTGAAYIYTHNSGTWTYEQKLSITADNQNNNDPHKGEQFDHFGSAVAIFGENAVIGAYGDDKNTGAAYVYKHNTGFWMALVKLTASDATEGACYGYSVAIYDDVIVVGAYKADGHWAASGAVYTYEQTASGQLYQTSKLFAHDGMSYDYFGFSVSVYQNVILVGAHGEEGKGNKDREKDQKNNQKDQKHMRKLPGEDAHQQHEGENCGPDSPPDCQQYRGEYSYRGTGAGAAYVFKRSNHYWGQVMKILPSYSEAYDHFGTSVATYREEFIVGADTADGVVEDTGAAYVFWPTFDPMGYRNDPDAENGDWRKESQQESSSSSSTSGSFFSGSGSSAVVLLVVVVPVVVAATWWFSTVNGGGARGSDGMVAVPQDSRHGSSVPWSSHGTFDESSWGLESSHAGNPLRASPLKAPANVGR